MLFLCFSLAYARHANASDAVDLLQSSPWSKAMSYFSSAPSSSVSRGREAEIERLKGDGTLAFGMEGVGKEYMTEAMGEAMGGNVNTKGMRNAFTSGTKGVLKEFTKEAAGAAVPFLDVVIDIGYDALHDGGMAGLDAPSEQRFRDIITAGVVATAKVLGGLAGGAIDVSAFGISAGAGTALGTVAAGMAAEYVMKQVWWLTDEWNAYQSRKRNPCNEACAREFMAVLRARDQALRERLREESFQRFLRDIDYQDKLSIVQTGHHLVDRGVSMDHPDGMPATPQESIDAYLKIIPTRKIEAAVQRARANDQDTDARSRLVKFLVERLAMQPAALKDRMEGFDSEYAPRRDKRNGRKSNVGAYYRFVFGGLADRTVAKGEGRIQDWPWPGYGATVRQQPQSTPGVTVRTATGRKQGTRAPIATSTQVNDGWQRKNSAMYKKFDPNCGFNGCTRDIEIRQSDGAMRWEDTKELIRCDRSGCSAI